MPEESLKKTPLCEEHVKLGARMVPFSGWTMPVQYSGLIDEHQCVRNRVGLFDVSHMGEFRVSGTDARAFLDSITVNNVARLKDGGAHYTAMTYPEGTVVDDLLIYRFAEDDYWMVVNAGNIEKDWQWVTAHRGDFDVQLENESDKTAQIAIQGPQAETVLARLTPTDLSTIRPFRFMSGKVAERDCIISRTGYTGEDGFELYCANSDAVAIWCACLASGEPEGIKPAGLGARDTLRLESTMALYGNDLDHTTSVLEAGLGWVLKLKKKSDFVGKDALRAEKEQGSKRQLVCFELTGRGIARHGYSVLKDGREIGQVTSGSHSPTLQKSIGMAYVPSAHAEPGTEIAIQIRKNEVPATIVKGPFYKRSTP